MKLNETQLKARNIKDKNVVVFASAGAGKTTVLISRLIKRIIEDKISLNDIVAMTFTEAAALNMKNRLRVALNNELLKTDDLDTIKYINNELANIENSNISTIHSFCLKILKEYYYLIPINSKALNNIADTTLIDVTLNNLLDNIINNYLSSDRHDLFISVVKRLNSEIFTFDAFKKNILSIHKTSLNKVEPIKWLKSLYITSDIKSFDELNQDIKDYYLNYIYLKINDILDNYQSILKLEDIEDKEAINNKYLEIKELLNIDDYKILINQLLLTLTPLPSKKHELYKKYRDNINKLSDEIASYINNEYTIITDYNNSKDIHNLLIDITITLSNDFKEYKFKHNLIDFNDFEHFTYQILVKDNYKIAHKLKDKYQEIMIDEFQDTNEIQYTIASLISNHNLFIVGDIKQSIYRFRSAKPEIMQKLKDNPDFEVINIKENYRSKKNLVDFNNTLFTTLMNFKDENYTEDDKQIAPTDNQLIDNIPVTFKLYINSGDKPDNYKAKLLANEIYKLNKEGTKLKDICILVRSHKDKIVIKKALNDLNIQYFTIDPESYLNSYIIDILYSYIKYILDPSDKISLYSILSSKLYEYSDEELYLISKDNNYLNNSKFIKDYYILKDYVFNNDYQNFFTYFLNINDIYDTKLNQTQRANIDLLISKFSTYGYNLNDLIYYIEDNADISSDTAYATSDDADVVKIMTIHGSKGLEFDTVFLYSSTSYRQSELNEAVICDENLGLGIKFMDEYHTSKETIIRKAIRQKDNIDDLNEYARLFYVALTRACRRLIIIDAMKKEEEFKANLSLIYQRKGFTSYLLAIMQNDPLFNIEIIQQLESYPPLKPQTTNYQYHKLNYKDIDEYKVIKPSDHQSSLKLDFNDNLGLSFGTKIHNILELIDFNNFTKESILKIDETLDNHLINYLLNFTKHDLFKEICKGKIIKEYSFYYKDNNSLIHGYMDLVVIYDDHIKLIDYKTDKLDDENEFIKLYTNQLKIYKDILVQAYNLKVESYIYSFNLNKFISIK